MNLGVSRNEHMMVRVISRPDFRVHASPFRLPREGSISYVIALVEALAIGRPRGCGAGATVASVSTDRRRGERLPHSRYRPAPEEDSIARRV